MSGDPNADAGGLISTLSGLSQPPTSGWRFWENGWVEDHQIKVSSKIFRFLKNCLSIC